MEMQLFDTELNMSPVDVSQIPKDEKIEEKGTEKSVQEVDNPEEEYTIIDVIDKSKKVEKETKEEEEPKEVKEKPTSDQSADSSKFPYSTFTKALYEEGVIGVDEEGFKALIEETGSEVEALIETQRLAINEGIDSYKNSLTKEGKEFLEALEAGVPLDRFIAAKSNEYIYDKIDESTLADDEELCKSLIREDLLMRGFDEDDIKDQIKDFDTLSKLDVKAKAALKKLKSAHGEQIKQEKIEAEKRNQQIVENNKKQMLALKAEIDKINEIVPGLKLNAKIKGELYDDITSPAEQAPNGQWLNAVYAKRSKDPIAFDIKLAYLNRLGIFDGDWKKLIAGSKSEAVKNLSDKLKGGTISETGESVGPEATPKAKDILRSMETFRTKR